MKNNEIMISARFESNELSDDISFLIIKDITLRALIEAIYYGLKKSQFEKHFALLETYLKTRKELQVLYNAKGAFDYIDFTDTFTVKDATGEHTVSILDKKLDELGFVTSSTLLFTTSLEIRPQALFQPCENSYILKNGDNLEYNISTRRLNVIESSAIDILPPGEMPQKSKQSFLDVLIPTLLSAVAMAGARMLMQAVSGGDSAAASMMVVMSLVMPVVALVTSTYNYCKQINEYEKSLDEWCSRYEEYINKKIETIKEWQTNDIKYLNHTYPDMGTLFENTACISDSIFSRSQNDNDFMRISLGTSDKVKPLFEIKAEKKDAITYDVNYIMARDAKTGKDRIQLIVPSRKEKKLRKKMTANEVRDREQSKLPLTDLPYNFANKDGGQGFCYLRSNDNTKPPLMVDLRSCGVLGVVSNAAETSLNFVRHVIFELAYYHSPEDLQFVFFFDHKYDEAIHTLEEELRILQKDGCGQAELREKEAALREAKKKKQSVLENYKYLPHANELFDGVSQFVFNKESSGIVFGQLLSIMNERVKNSADSDEEKTGTAKQTQIVCVVFDDYNIKETGFSKFLPEVPKEGEPYVNKNGLTFIFLQDHAAKLPKYCGNIVKIHDINRKERTSTLRYNVLHRESLAQLSEGDGATNNTDRAKDTDVLTGRVEFDNEYIFGGQADLDDRFRKAYKQLSAIYYTRVAENGKVPSMVTLFELYGFDSDSVSKNGPRDVIRGFWKNEKNDDEYNVTRNLRVPIGKNEHGPICLDLYEKADGPHMLVAGTTGSGKSETIITYLIGLCMKFSPMDLNLMLVDMKGGGFSDRLGGLPHCVGAVTDTAGEEEGTSAAYMLKRFLQSLNAEIKRRKLLLTNLGVDNVDAYIRALRTIKKIKENEKDPQKRASVQEDKKKLNEKQLAALDKDMDELQPLSHLVLVVDEFTELKRFSSESNDIDFIAEITTIARVGRTLGFHIILVSQNIEGAITDDIRVNSKARICLKVATKQASKEMIDSPVAAAPTMPLNGRAYLLVGTGSRFEYFQSAYTGANKNLNIEGPVEVTRVPDSGSFDRKFYSSKIDNEKEKKKNKNVNEHDTQLAYITKTIIEMSKNEEKPKPIFLPPLPSKIVDETEWSFA